MQIKHIEFKYPDPARDTYGYVFTYRGSDYLFGSANWQEEINYFLTKLRGHDVTTYGNKYWAIKLLSKKYTSNDFLVIQVLWGYKIEMKFTSAYGVWRDMLWNSEADEARADLNEKYPNATPDQEKECPVCLRQNCIGDCKLDVG